jgi:hypothetical protein
MQTVEIFSPPLPGGEGCELCPMRMFEAGDGMEQVPGVVWVVAIAVVTGVVAVGVAIVAGGLWLTDWLGWKT